MFHKPEAQAKDIHRVEESSLALFEVALMCIRPEGFFWAEDTQSARFKSSAPKSLCSKNTPNPAFSCKKSFTALPEGAATFQPRATPWEKGTPITPALKGHDMFGPFRAGFLGNSHTQGVALGWNMTAPSGRIPRKAQLQNLRFRLVNTRQIKTDGPLA